MELVLITALAFVSALVTSIFGFGAGMVLTPLLGLLMPLPDALGIGALVFLFTSGSKVVWYLHDIDWRVMRSAFLLSLPGLLAGFTLVATLDVRLLQGGYALLLIVFAVNMLRGTDQRKSLLPAPCYPLCGGLFSVLMHSGGVFMLRYGQFYALGRLQLVGTVAALHFFMNIFKTAFFTTSGMVESSYIYRLIPAYLAAILGTRLGRMVLGRYVDERLFSKGVAVLLLLLAARFLYDLN